MMRRIFTYLLLFTLTGLSSCAIFRNGSKSSESKPSWALQRPQTDVYYVGIGSANKSGLSPNAYQQNAKNAALNDLSSEISVNISSSSVISTLETDYNLSENYQRTIKASSDKNLEGYETVDTWEGDEYYWVYIRLSKMDYQQQVAEKKLAAINKAKDKYLQARDIRTENQIYEAIHMYIDAFSDISEYLAESTSTKIDGKPVDLGTAIYRDLVNTLNEITISTPVNPISVTSGKSINPDLLTMHVSNKEGNALPNLPFKLNFTGSGLIDNRLTSNRDGELQPALNRIYSNNQREKLSVELDMLSISRLTRDIFIRTLVKKIPPPGYTLDIRIKSPLIYVESRENSLGRQSESKVLYNAILQAMAENNMRISDSQADADFIIRVESDTERATTNSYQKTAILHYTLTVLDKDKRMMYRKNENRIKGYGNTNTEACDEAYQEGANVILRKNFQDIKRSVFSP